MPDSYRLKTLHFSPHAPEPPSGITSVRRRTVLLLLCFLSSPFITFFTADDLYYGAVYRLPLFPAQQNLGDCVTEHHGSSPTPTWDTRKRCAGGVLFSTTVVAAGAVSSLESLEIGSEAPMSGKELGQIIRLATKSTPEGLVSSRASSRPCRALLAIYAVTLPRFRSLARASPARRRRLRPSL